MQNGGNPKIPGLSTAAPAITRETGLFRFRAVIVESRLEAVA